MRCWPSDATGRLRRHRFGGRRRQATDEVHHRPAADHYWDAVGTIEDAEVVVHVAPATEEEWAAVVNSAYVVTEGGDLLMMTGRAKDSGDWMKLSQVLIDVGQRAIKAAESKNTQAVFDAGAEDYDA